MTARGWLQIGLFLAVVLVLVRPLGTYMAMVFEGNRVFAVSRVLHPVERLIYKLAGVDREKEMGWKGYAGSVLLFSLGGFLLLYVLQLIQGWLPGGPEGVGNVRPGLAFNTAVSFVTNTNWQAYSGETTMKYVTQMVGLTVQNFVSAGAGIAVLIAFIRGFSRHTVDRLGNFWVDLTRATLYVLLPLAFIFAVALVSQGVVQTFSSSQEAQLVQPYTQRTVRRSRLSPSLSGRRPQQEAIKQLGRTGAASSTPTLRTPSRIPHRSPTSWSWWRSCSFRPLSATPSGAWWAIPSRAGWCWRR